MDALRSLVAILALVGVTSHPHPTGTDDGITGFEADPWLTPLSSKPVPRPPLLAHPRRIAILAYLRNRRSASLVELQRHLNTSSSVASWHVRQLVRAHHIRRVHRDGETRFAAEVPRPGRNAGERNR